MQKHARAFFLRRGFIDTKPRGVIVLSKRNGISYRKVSDSMNKKLSITLIAILAVAAIAFGALFFIGQGDKDALTKNLETARQELQASQAQAETLTADLASANEKVQTLTGDLETANTKNEALAGELETANTKNETLNQELETSKAETASAQELAEAAAAEKTALSAELEKFKVKQSELETELQTNSAALTQANSELETARADLDAKNAQIATMSGDLETTKADLDARNAQIETMTGDLEDARSRLATAQQNSGSVAPVTVPDSEGTYDATKFFTHALDEKGIKYTYEGLSGDNGDIVTSIWTLKDVDVKFVILFQQGGRVFLRAFNVIDYNASSRGQVLETLNTLNDGYLFVNWTVDDSDNSVTAKYDLPEIDPEDAGSIVYLAMDAMVDVVNTGMDKLKPFMK